MYFMYICMYVLYGYMYVCMHLTGPGLESVAKTEIGPESLLP